MLKTFRRCSNILTYLAILLITAPATVQAGSYAVTASVAFPAPTQAAIIDSSLDNKTVNDAQLRVYGTCESLNPDTVIVIMRSGETAGSGSCATNNTFSIEITLRQGANTLVARSASVSGLYGPDSSPISVKLILNEPPVAQPQTVNPRLSEEKQQQDSPIPNPVEDKDINQAVSEGFEGIISVPFTTLSVENNAHIDISISGGKSPYTINVNWGDGTIDSKVVQTASTYGFDHVYKKAGTYRVKSTARDVLGAVTVYEHTIVSTQPVPKKATTSPAKFIPKKSVNYFIPLMLGSLLLVALLTLLAEKRHGSKK